MQKKRPQPQRKNRFSCLGCLAVLGGCALVTVLSLAAGWIIFREQIVIAGLGVLGLQAEGQTETVLAASVPAIPTVPPLTNSTQPQAITITDRNDPTISGTLQNNQGVQITTGSSAEGEVATITSTEEELQRLCQAESNACNRQGVDIAGFMVRNAELDLKPGAAIVRAEISGQGGPLPIGQELGMVFQVAESGDQLILRGIEVGGVLFSQPPAEFDEVVDIIQDTLEYTSTTPVWTTNGTDYQIDRIIIEEGKLTVLLK